MAKQKNNPKHRDHKKVAGGILAAALALMVVVATQVGDTNTDLFKAQTAGDCSTMGMGYWWNGTSCQPPSGGGGSYTPPPGDTYVAPTTISCSSLNGANVSVSECDAADQRRDACASPSVWNGSNGGSCTAPAAPAPTTTTTGGSASSYVTDATCNGAGYFWSMTRGQCYSTQADKQAAEGTSTYSGSTYSGSGGAYPAGTCSDGRAYPAGNGYPPCSTTSGSTYSGSTYSGAVDTVDACTHRYGTDGRPGVWYAASSTCSVAPGTSNTNTATQNWLNKRVIWNSLGVESMVCDNAPQAEIDARKLVVKDLKPSMIVWPNGSDCSKTDKRAGFPEKGDGTNTTWSGASGTSGTWSGASGTSGWTSGMASGYQGGAGQYISKDSCDKAGYFWGTNSRWCYNNRADLDMGEKNAGTNYMTSGTSGWASGSTDTARQESECSKSGGFWVAGTVAGGYNNGYCKYDKFDDNKVYTQTNNNQYDNQWRDPASYGSDPEGCRNAGFFYDDERSDCFPSQHDIYGLGDMVPTTWGPPMTGGFQPPFMNFGPGTDGQYFNEGNFMPPTYNAEELTRSYAQYGFGEDNYQFDKFQIDWNADYQGPAIQNRKQEVNRVKREGKEKLREINQFEKEFERSKARSGGNAVCPAIANASAALSTAKAVVELMTNATEETIEQALNAQGQLFGNWENPDGIWNTVMQAIQGTHQCEQLAQMQKETGRELKQMAKEMGKVRNAELKAELQGYYDTFSDIVSNIGSYVDFAACDGVAYCDPMEEVRWRMDELRMNFWDLMREQQDEFQYDDVCGNFEMIREHLSTATDIPANILKKASGMLNRGVAYCEAGNIDAATGILGEFEIMKRQFDDGGGEDEGFRTRDAVDYMKEAIALEYEDGEGLDVEDLVAKITEKLENEFFSRMQTAVQAAVDRVTQEYTLKIAQLESDFAGRLAEFQAASLDNTNIANFDSELKDAIIESKSEVTEAVGDLDKVLVAFEKEEVEIPAEVEEQITEIYEFATVHNMTEEAASEFRAEIDAGTNELIIAFQEDPQAAVEVLAEVVAEIRDEGERIYAEDKGRQLENGMLSFGDLHGMEDDWKFGYATAAKNMGFVNGDVDPVTGDKVMNAGADTNWAVALTMTARAAAGGEENIPNEVDLANPVVREMPDWAQAPVTYLLNEDRMEADALRDLYSNSNPGDDITRVELMGVLYDALDLPVEDIDLSFPDVSGLSDAEMAATRALVGAGIVNGEGDGSLNPDGTTNRAALAKMLIGSQKLAISAGTVAIPTSGGNLPVPEEEVEDVPTI